MAGHPLRGDLRFVGRDDELALIAETCATARAGPSRLVVISGPAGVGKTTLCQQAMANADDDGVVVAWGHSWPDGGAPPLWPWTSVLAELGGPDAAGLLAEDGQRTAVDADRFARFCAVADVLVRRSRQAPVAIVLDDAHLADGAALLLARFLIRSVDRCVIMVTRRSDGTGTPEIRRRLDDLERDAMVVTLRPFDQAETAAFLDAHGLPIGTYGLASALARLTGGNPLLLARAVANASPASDLSAVEHLIDHFMEALGPEDRDVVALAAVLGMEATTAELTAMVGGDHGDVVDALHRASATGLVDLRPGGWAFTHDLVRHAALGVLTARETVEAHVRALDLAPFDDRPAAAARRAHHALRAAERSPADAARAVDECRTAAHVLGSGFDYERAAALLESAVELVERSSSPPDHVVVLLEWADALMVCGGLADARRAYERAVDVAGRAGDPATRARAALGLGGVWVNEQRSEVERTRVLGLQRAALAELPIDAVALRGRLVTRLAAEAVYDGAPVEPTRAALEQARRTDDPRVLAEALSLTHHALLAPEHLEERRRLADELITVAAGCGDDLRVLFGLLWKSVDQFLGGDLQAMRTLSELRTRADAVGCRSIAYVVSALDVMQLIREGRLADAEAAAHDCFEHGVDVGDLDATGYYGAHMLTIRWLQDRDSELLELARDIASSSILIKPEFAYRAGAAAIAARAGLIEEAATMLGVLRQHTLADLPRSSTWLTGMANIIEAAARLGDAELAREAYALVEPFASRPVMPSLAVTCFGTAARVLGLAALTFGDAEVAVDHLERAVEANIRLGNRPMTAMARADLAAALLARGWSGDRGGAVAALHRAAQAAADMKMTARAEEWARSAAELIEVSEATVLRRDGNRWIVDHRGRQVVLPDLVGVGYLGVLLARPGEDVSALELCGGVAVDGSYHDVIDRQALQSYRRRVGELDEQLEAARRDGPERQVERLERERAALRDELSTVVARSGRARHFAGSAERARTAVRKAIARAIDVVAASNPDLADELRATITTGRTCTYLPDPKRPRQWVFDDA